MSARLLAKLLRKLPGPLAYAAAEAQADGTLPSAHHAAVEYHLATQGYALRRPLALVRTRHDHPVLQDGTLHVPRRAVGRDGLRRRFLHFDLPCVLVYGPRTRQTDASADAAALAAYLLALRSLTTASSVRPWLSVVEAEEVAATLRGIDDATLLRAVLDQHDVAAPPADVMACARAVRLQDRRLALRPDEGRTLPTLPVTPDTLTFWEVPPVAVSWLMDRYGWSRTDTGHTIAKLLPLQVLGIARGICGQLLARSGVIAGPTSAGKTLLAEARMLARYFAPKGRRKTIMLVPTREVGLERYDEFMAAYGVGERTRNLERRMNICYSDGEHHADDRNIWEGRFDLAIMINEKFRFFQQNKRFLNGVGEVVFDELEVLADETRGTYLELALTSAALHHRDMTVLGLSRPARHFDALLELMRFHGAEPFLLETDHRPLDIEVGLWGRHNRAVYRNCNTGRRTMETHVLGYPNKKETLRRLLELFVRQTPAERAAGLRNNLVLAAPTKAKNLELAFLLEGLFYSDAEVRATLSANMRTTLIDQRLRGLEPTQRKAALERLLPLGIGIHDADLTTDERRLVSRAFRDGELAVLVCTQTFAYGVNLPAQTIVFIDWGKAPGRNGDYPPFYHGLGDYFDAWLGRVGRYGLGTHRLARALYLCSSRPGSDEWKTMSRLIEAEKDHLVTHMERADSLELAVLYAVRSLRHALAEYPTWVQLDAFFKAAPSVQEGSWGLSNAFLKATRRLGRLDFHRAYYDLFYAAKRVLDLDEPSDDEALEQLETACSAVPAVLPDADVGVALRGLLGLVRTGEPGPLVEYVTSTGFAGRMLTETDAAEVRGLRLHEGRFELTRLGTTACAHGVRLGTCLHFYQWLAAHDGRPWTWDLFDLLVLVRASPDGRAVRLLRTSAAAKQYVEAAFEAHLGRAAVQLGPLWQERTLVTEAATKGYRRKATLLALRDWRAGVALHGEAGEDIETTLGLYAHGSNLYRHARDYARLLRVLADVAQAFPEGTFPPERPADIPEQVICVPYDLDAVSAELQYGLPYAAADLAALSVEGLSRTWVLRLYEAVEARQIDTDLPLIDRVRTLSADAEAFREAFPTPGLAARVAEALADQPRMALAESLRGDAEKTKAFYAHPAVVQAHLLQGFERYTALRVRHRGIYAVFRRNVVKGTPIVLEQPADVAEWVQRGAVEFLAEIGQVRTDGFLADRLFVDLDPVNDYPLAKLKHLAGVLADRFAHHRWVDPGQVYVHWSGGKGFHVIGRMKQGAFRPVETVRLETKRLLLHLCDDVEIFLEEHKSIVDPYVVLDLSPVKARGVYRNAFSIHANTGGVCIPVAVESLGAFEPDAEAAIGSVLARLGQAAQAATSYRDLVRTFLGSG